MKLLVAGGGTGGHLYPGIAVAEAFRRAVPRADVVFVGTSRGLEAREVPARGFRFHVVDAQPLKGMDLARLVRGVFALPRAVVQMLRLLAKERPDLVVGVGGYSSGPAILAAALSGIPSALLEQNAVPGLANRLSAPFVRRAYLTFPESARYFGARRARAFGNPVREAIADAGESPVPKDGLVLVFGGSLGARALNRTVPEALAYAKVTRAIVHQAGPRDCETVAARYRELGLAAEVRSFLEDMPDLLSRASLVICRAGATTLAELCVVGRPAILIPFPFATDDHQTKNAEALHAAGAAIRLDEKELSVEALGSLVRVLLADPQKLNEIGQRAKERGRPHAAAEIVADLLTSLSPRPLCRTEEAHV